jgi:hypothetical protein
MSADEPAIDTEQLPMTLPLGRGAEIRCYMRDRDAYPIEAEATGLVEGRLAEEAPAGGGAGGTDGR